MSVDLTGRQFTRLFVVEKAGIKGHDRMWLCRCVCGSVKEVSTTHLVNCRIKSCGCLQKETRGKHRLTHGQSRTPEYVIWVGMKSRCKNPNHDSYPYYGGRGITYAPEWESFESFFKDVGPRPSSSHTLDRENVNGNYEPGNVTWATKKEQANNRRNKRLDQFSLEELQKELERRRQDYA